RNSTYQMKRALLSVFFAGLAVLAATITPLRGAADTPALAGAVRSNAEGLMEGVVVTAQREGSSVLTAVTTNEHGQYAFPRSHLPAGKYTVTIRAAGYVLPGERAAVQVEPEKSAHLDLTLKAASQDQLAHQLTSVEWWRSMPGTDAQKDLLI